MIEVRKIWDDIKKAGLEEYVSVYEKWFKAEEVKKYIKEKKILIESGRKAVYFFIFLYFVVSIVSIGYIWQGITESVGHRVFFGIIYLVLSGIALWVWISKRYTAMVFVLEDGILSGISNKDILRTFKYQFSFLPYSAISKIYVEDRTSELKTLVIVTKDDKIWQKSKKYNTGYFILNKKEVDKYLTTIYKQMGKVKDETT